MGMGTGTGMVTRPREWLRGVVCGMLAVRKGVGGIIE